MATGCMQYKNRTRMVNLTTVHVVRQKCFERTSIEQNGGRVQVVFVARHEQRAGVRTWPTNRVRSRDARRWFV